MIRKLAEGLSRELELGRSLPMQIRLFQLYCLIVTVLTIFVVLPVNWFQNLPILVNIEDVLLGMIALFCFWESTRGRHHTILFLIIMVLLLEPVWFLNSGADGSITLYFLVTITYPMLVFRGFRRWALTVCMIINVCALLVIEYFFPSLTVPFHSRTDRLLDLVTGVICSCIGLAMIMWTLISSYERERERTEKNARDLADQHDNLSGLIESIGSAIFSVDRNFNYLSFNKTHAQLMRILFNAEIEIGGNLLEYHANPEHRDKARHNLEKTLSGEKVLSFEQINIAGKESSFEISHHPIVNARREVIGAAVYSRDITERKAAEIALKQSEERLRNFIEHAPAALAMFDRQMRYLSVSRRWLNDYGIGRDILGKSHYEVFPKLPERLREIHCRGLAGEVIRVEEDQFQGEDGSTRWVSWEMRPWHDAMGQIAGVVIFSEDITGRKQAEQALIETHRRLTATVAAIPDLLFELDADGRICEYHAHGDESLYAPPEAFLGKTVDQVLPLESAGIVLSALEQAALKGSHRGSVYSLDMPGGQRWFELSITVKPGDSAQGVHYVALVRDITERKRAEEEKLILLQELALYSRAATVSELTGTIAHDLNQPLAAILSNAETALCLLQRENPDLGELREIFDDIVADDKRAAELIRSVRSMLRREDTERLPLSLNDVIGDVLSLVRNYSQARNINIALDLETPIPQITGERVQLQQIILNLIINALEAMEGSGTPGDLTIRLRKSDKEILLDVIDSGPGIPPENLDAIFKPFFTTKKNGLGIGLPLSRTIVNSHGGSLWADNNEGKGATFHVSLPAYRPGTPIERENASTLRLRSQPGPSRPSNIRVLLADDDEMFLARTADMLNAEPEFDVVGTVDNGQAAIELAARLRPDIILMDIDMPKRNGIEATQAITREYPEICIIGLSMHEDAERAKTMLNAGATKYLNKNCQSAELINAIRNRAATGSLLD